MVVRDAAASVGRVWRGEIGLFRAAYGLGGVGGAFGAAVGDYFLDLRLGSDPAQWLLFAGAAIGELLFAWVCVVATSRARRRRHYGMIPVALALVFVWAQLLFTAGWVACSGLAAVGLATPPMRILIDDILKPEMQALLPPSERHRVESLAGHLGANAAENSRLPVQERASR